MAVRDFKKCTITIQDGTVPTPNTLEIELGEGNFTVDETRNVEYRLNRGVLGSVREGDEVPVEVSIDADLEYYSGPAALDPTAIDNVAGYGIGDTVMTVDTMADIPSYGRVFTIATETGTPEHTVQLATATSITFTPALVSAVADGDAIAFTAPPTLSEILSLAGNASSWKTTDPDPCNLPCIDLIMEYDPGTCGDTETSTLQYFRWESKASDLSEGTLSISGKCNITEMTHTRS